MPTDRQARPSDAEADIYSDDGVDLTLIREALAMTPAERLAALESFMADLAVLIDAKDAASTP